MDVAYALITRALQSMHYCAGGIRLVQIVNYLEIIVVELGSETYTWHPRRQEIERCNLLVW